MTNTLRIVRQQKTTALDLTALVAGNFFSRPNSFARLQKILLRDRVLRRSSILQHAWPELSIDGSRLTSDGELRWLAWVYRRLGLPHQDKLIYLIN